MRKVRRIRFEWSDGETTETELSGDDCDHLVVAFLGEKNQHLVICVPRAHVLKAFDPEYADKWTDQVWRQVGNWMHEIIFGRGHRTEEE